MTSCGAAAVVNLVDKLGCKQMLSECAIITDSLDTPAACGIVAEAWDTKAAMTHSSSHGSYKPVLLRMQEGDPAHYPPIFAVPQIQGSGKVVADAFVGDDRVPNPIFAFNEPYLSRKASETHAFIEKDGAVDLLFRGEGKDRTDDEGMLAEKMINVYLESIEHAVLSLWESSRPERTTSQMRFHVLGLSAGGALAHGIMKFAEQKYSYAPGALILVDPIPPVAWGHMASIHPTHFAIIFHHKKHVFGIKPLIGTEEEEKHIQPTEIPKAWTDGLQDSVFLETEAILDDVLKREDALRSVGKAEAEIEEEIIATYSQGSGRMDANQLDVVYPNPTMDLHSSYRCTALSMRFLKSLQSFKQNNDWFGAYGTSESDSNSASGAGVIQAIAADRKFMQDDMGCSNVESNTIFPLHGYGAFPRDFVGDVEAHLSVDKGHGFCMSFMYQGDSSAAFRHDVIEFLKTKLLEL